VYAQKSTIVRAVRPMFKSLESTAPGIGSAIIERLVSDVAGVKV